jgi:hypothetical protein
MSENSTDPRDIHVAISWRDCDCEWSTKTCDELHLRRATVSRAALRNLTAGAVKVER